MGFWDTLFKILPEKLHIKIASDNKSKKIEYHDNRQVIILGNLNKKELDGTKNYLKKLVFEKKIPILEEETKKLFEDIAVEDRNPKNQEILEYFQGKLPTSDLEILRAALIIKSKYKKGEPVSHLKEDIVLQYGIRGRNIANLCTADYFETLIKPLYEETIKNKLPFVKFAARYEIIVMQYPFAVFVSSRMTYPKLKSELQRKIIINKTYGITKINIHGIGKNNVKKIYKLLDELRSKFSQSPEIDSGKNFITATIYF